MAMQKMHVDSHVATEHFLGVWEFLYTFGVFPRNTKQTGTFSNDILGNAKMSAMKQSQSVASRDPGLHAEVDM